MGITNNTQIAALKKTFDDYKHYDEYGREYWNAHELSKLMGYTDYRNFNQAIERAKQQMISTGRNPEDHLVGSNEMVQIGSGARREVSGYILDRYAAYLISMNADPSKIEVAFAQEYFLQSTATLEFLQKRIYQKEYINNRDILRDANKGLNAASLTHGVKPNQLGICANVGDQAYLHMSTKEAKKRYGIDNSKPLSDFYGRDMALHKAVAQHAASVLINRHDVNGLDNVNAVIEQENSIQREEVKRIYGDAPENLITGENINDIRKDYKHLSKELQKAIEQEF